MTRLQTILTIYRKEISDALRDRRTLLTVLVSSVLMGPLVLLAISGLVASLEASAEQREVVVADIARAPTLVNFLERQTYTVKPAPAGYEALLRKAKLADAVIVVPKDFEAALLRGDAPIVEIVVDSANQRSQASAGRVERLLAGFSRERATLTLALRGVSPDAVEPVRVEERDLASTQTRATQITGMLPFFILMAVLTGSLNAALDTTAGERERGSLEPLLMNPVQQFALVLGKWGAVALLGMAVALLASLSFVPAQWLLRSDSLQAMFQFGGAEVMAFLLLQLPLAAGLGAVLMAFAIRSKTFKEAQAGSTLVVTVVGMAPLVSLLNPGGDAGWYLWVPGLAQNTLMMLVLKGEALSVAQVLPGVLVGALLTVGSLMYVAHSMRGAVAK